MCAVAAFSLPNERGILIVSPNAESRHNARRAVSGEEWKVLEVSGGAEALSAIDSYRCKVVLLDRNLPDLDYREIVGFVESKYPGTEVVLLDENGAPEISKDSQEDAAYNWLLADVLAAPKPISLSELEEPLPGVIGSGSRMREITRMTRLVAKHETPVLITGETGTGKELIAHAIHVLGARASAPLVTLNCAAIPEALLESELFGYAKGAFTGAVQSNIGKIQAAQSGSLFLDEIGDMPLSLQAKLLRFLENGEVQRLGTAETFHADVRIIAATNSTLFQKVKDGAFRQDLYYRLSVFPIDLPPLRHRGEDLLELAEHFLKKCSDHCISLSADAIAALGRHNWPGNVRELLHTIERACILANGKAELSSEHIVIRQLF